ncbi:MAG: DUF6880 family protein [Sporichthyaceae bacterium]
MTNLADTVLPLIRTRAELWRWSAANAHGRQMHEAVDILERATETEDPAVVLTVTQKAVASAMGVIAKADDSSGIIGDACRRLLDLHPTAAARAKTPSAKLVAWMIDFQFHGKVDYFELDPAAYAPALGEKGMATYRSRLEEIRTGLGPRPAERWNSVHSHEWFVLDWNAQRLAVHDRDVEAIVATHARDRKVAAWLHDTAKALAEADYPDLAIDWAKQATDFDDGHQARAAGDYWCTLLAQHRPDDLLAARQLMFDRWPCSGTAAALHDAAGPVWPTLQTGVYDRLADSPRDAVLFALLTLRDPEQAWTLAHTLGLSCTDTWTRLAKEYQKHDPLAVLPVLAMLVETDLVRADARNYQIAARRLKTMRKLAAGTEKASEVDDLVAGLREEHRRRPRLQQEFDRAGLP